MDLTNYSAIEVSEILRTLILENETETINHTVDIDFNDCIVHVKFTGSKYNNHMDECEVYCEVHECTLYYEETESEIIGTELLLIEKNV